MLLLNNGRKPTIKQRKFIKSYLKTGNATKSALEVYKCKDESAGQIGWMILKQIDYAYLLEAMGVSDHELTTKLQEGLNADKLNVTTNGNITTNDYATRHKYLETAFKLKNRLQQQPIVNSYEHPTIKIFGGGYTPSIRGSEAGGVSRNVIPSLPPKTSHRSTKEV